MYFQYSFSHKKEFRVNYDLEKIIKSSISSVIYPFVNYMKASQKQLYWTSLL